MAETNDESAPERPDLPQERQVPTQTIVLQTGGGRLWRILCWLGWAGFVACAILLAVLLKVQDVAMDDYFDTTEGIEEKYHSGYKYGRDKVAIISVAGAILNGKSVKRQIDRVREDENVKAVVLRVDSPGGTVYGSDYIYHHLKRLRKEKAIPLVVSMGGIAASGGYYVSMAVGDQKESIFAEPTTTTGSIGVMIPHYDLSGLLAKFDVKDDTLVTHPRKGMLRMTRPMSEDHRQVLQTHLDELFGRFKDIIKEGRPAFRMDPDVLDQLATGEPFTAMQAKKHGLVDGIDFIEAAIDRAIELANLDKAKTRVVELKRPPALLEIPGLIESNGQSLDLATWLDMNAPRAYYLSTTLPTLVTNRREDFDR